MTNACFLALLKAVTLLSVTPSCLGITVDDHTTVIDLTYPLKENESMTWPTNPSFDFTIRSRQYNDFYETWLESNHFAMPEHMGTHMDAPAHMAEGKWRVHQIPAERLSGPGVVVDVKEKVKGNDVYQVTVKDLQDWESQHGEMPERAVVLVNFGWASRYPNMSKVFNTDDLLNLTSFRFPSVTEEAGRWLMEKRRIHALGTDTPSADTRHMVVHKMLLANNILLLENVANLDSLPAKGTTIVIGVLKLYDGSGAPMRLLAFSAGWRLEGAYLPCLGLILIRLLLR